MRTDGTMAVSSKDVPDTIPYGFTSQQGGKGSYEFKKKQEKETAGTFDVPSHGNHAYPG
jgi:hypothetical protein